jgi:hypothetical protein
MAKKYKLHSGMSINQRVGTSYPEINSDTIFSGISAIKKYLKKGAYIFGSFEDELGKYTSIINLNFDAGLFFRNWDVGVDRTFEPANRPVRPKVLDTLSASADIHSLPEEQLDEVLSYEKAFEEWDSHKKSETLYFKKQYIDNVIEAFLEDIPDNLSLLVQQQIK